MATRYQGPKHGSKDNTESRVRLARMVIGDQLNRFPYGNIREFHERPKAVALARGAYASTFMDLATPLVSIVIGVAVGLAACYFAAWALHKLIA
jgi:hypothetical protein